MNDLDFFQFYINYMVGLFSNMEIEKIKKYVTVPVQTVMIKLPCSKCENGFLEAQASLYTPFSDEPMVLHQCNSCDFADYLIGESYPYVKYLEENE
jgi:hypothetical protein